MYTDRYERLIMTQFDHEKLEVYKAAIEFVVLVENIVENLPRGRNYLVDQIQRAGTSIALNIAEGAGEFSKNEKIRFYRIAKRSATECAAILDVCRKLGIIEPKNFESGRTLLIRIVSMLIKMTRK